MGAQVGCSRRGESGSIASSARTPSSCRLSFWQPGAVPGCQRSRVGKEKGSSRFFFLPPFARQGRPSFVHRKQKSTLFHSRTSRNEERLPEAPPLAVPDRRDEPPHAPRPMTFCPRPLAHSLTATATCRVKTHPTTFPAEYGGKVLERRSSIWAFSGICGDDPPSRSNSDRLDVDRNDLVNAGD